MPQCLESFPIDPHWPFGCGFICSIVLAETVSKLFQRILKYFEIKKWKEMEDPKILVFCVSCQISKLLKPATSVNTAGSPKQVNFSGQDKKYKRYICLILLETTCLASYFLALFKQVESLCNTHMPTSVSFHRVRLWFLFQPTPDSRYTGIIWNCFWSLFKMWLECFRFAGKLKT